LALASLFISSPVIAHRLLMRNYVDRAMGLQSIASICKAGQLTLELKVSQREPSKMQRCRCRVVVSVIIHTIILSIWIPVSSEPGNKTGCTTNLTQSIAEQIPAQSLHPSLQSTNLSLRTNFKFQTTFA